MSENLSSHSHIIVWHYVIPILSPIPSLYSAFCNFKNSLLPFIQYKLDEGYRPYKKATTYIVDFYRIVIVSLTGESVISSTATKMKWSKLYAETHLRWFVVVYTLLHLCDMRDWDVVYQCTKSYRQTLQVLLPGAICCCLLLDIRAMWCARFVKDCPRVVGACSLCSLCSNLSRSKLSTSTQKSMHY